MADQTEKNFSTPEPAPVANDNPAVWDLVIADTKIDTTSITRVLTPRLAHKALIQKLLLKDFQDRSDFGFKKYGVRLQVGNKRDALVDLFQEVCDAVVYSRLCLEERGLTPINDNGIDMEDVYLDLLDTAHQLRAAIYKRDGK